MSEPPEKLHCMCPCAMNGNWTKKHQANSASTTPPPKRTCMEKFPGYWDPLWVLGSCRTLDTMLQVYIGHGSISKWGASTTKITIVSVVTWKQLGETTCGRFFIVLPQRFFFFFLLMAVERQPSGLLTVCLIRAACWWVYCQSLVSIYWMLCIAEFP